MGVVFFVSVRGQGEEIRPQLSLCGSTEAEQILSPLGLIGGTVLAALGFFRNVVMWGFVSVSLKQVLSEFCKRARAATTCFQ